MWSGADYLQDITDIPHYNLNINATKYWSSNGDYSIQLTNTINEYSRIEFTNNQQTFENETYTGTVDILNNSEHNIQLRMVEETGMLVQDVTIPPNNELQTVSITRTITANTVLRFQLINRYPIQIYVDNIQLNKR